MRCFRSVTSAKCNVSWSPISLNTGSEAWYTINGSAPKTDSWDSIAGLYPTKDLDWVRIHTNFPQYILSFRSIPFKTSLTIEYRSHRSGILSILAIPDPPDNPATRSAVEEAILQRKAYDFEEECAEKGFCVSAFRSLDEWERHPQSMSLQGCPPVQVIKIRDGQARISSNRRRPLDGIKVLDLGRVLAGPIAGRTLAGKCLLNACCNLKASLCQLSSRSRSPPRHITLFTISSSTRRRNVLRKTCSST